MALWILKWLRIAEEFDDDRRENDDGRDFEGDELFWLDVEDDDDDDAVVVVKGILDGTGFLNDKDLNDDGLISESIGKKRKRENIHYFFCRSFRFDDLIQYWLKSVMIVFSFDIRKKKNLRLKFSCDAE